MCMYIYIAICYYYFVIIIITIIIIVIIYYYYYYYYYYYCYYYYITHTHTVCTHMCVFGIFGCTISGPNLDRERYHARNLVCRIIPPEMRFFFVGMSHAIYIPSVRKRGDEHGSGRKITIWWSPSFWWGTRWILFKKERSKSLLVKFNFDRNMASLDRSNVWATPSGKPTIFCLEIISNQEL